MVEKQKKKLSKINSWKERLKEREINGMGREKFPKVYIQRSYYIFALLWLLYTTESDLK